MIQKSKALHSIVINGCMIHTYLSYNLKTNHIGIGTSHQFINKDKIKQYKKSKKYKIYSKLYSQRYYYNNQDSCKKDQKNRRSNKPNYTELGSLEHRIKRSCIIQNIERKNFSGFLTEQKYCKLFNEKFKEIIRERFHNKCYLCGTITKRKLSVHHVNYDKNCLCNSGCEFVPLCQSCHAKTNYNHKYWEDLIMCYLYSERYFIVDI